MLWLMTMGRRLNGVYAAFMLVAFMMGVLYRKRHRRDPG